MPESLSIQVTPDDARLRALQDLVLGPTSTLELEEVLQRVANLARRLVAASDAHIFLYDATRDELTLVALHMEPGRTVAPPEPRRTGVTYTVARTGTAIFVDNGSTFPAYENTPPDARPGALAILPLLVTNRVLGILNLGFSQPRSFDAETRDLLDLLARHAATAIDHAQLYAKSQRRAHELTALYEISMEISGELDLQKLLEDIVRRSRELLAATGAYLFMFDPERETLKLIAQEGLEAYMGREVKLGEGMSGRVALARRAMAVDNYHRWAERAASFDDVPLGATVAAPLLWQDELLGALGLYLPEDDPRVFNPDEIRLVEQLAAQAAIAIQNARLYTQTRIHEQALDQRLQELALVSEISHHVNQLDLNAVQQSALEQVVLRFGAVYAALGLYDPAAETVTVTAVRPANDPLLGTVLRVENNPDLAQAMSLRHAVVWQDDPDLVSTHPTRVYFRSRGTQQLILAPLLVKDRVIGFMGIDPGPRPIAPSEVNLIQTVANQVAIAMENARLAQAAIDNARIERELQVARSVQSRFLGHDGPQLPGWELAAQWRPAREVSGDFYDFIPLPDGKLGVVIGDATDKGMPAALVMATTRAVIRAVAWGQQSPGAVLERVNDLLYPDMPPRMFVTCFYGILDPASGRLRFANAGHDLPCHRGPSGVSKLMATGLPLGLMTGMPYEENQVVVSPGEMVLFYSDGLIEAHNPNREMYGYARVAQRVEQATDGRGLIACLLDDLAAFAGADSEQEDDVTLVALGRLGSA